MTFVDPSDQNRATQQGASTLQGTAENKVKNKLPKIQPYEDISASAELLGQVMQQLQSQALAFDSKPLESLLSLLATFNVNDLLANHVTDLRAHLLELNASLQMSSGSLPANLKNPSQETSNASNTGRDNASNVEAGLFSVQESVVHQLDTQSIMSENLSSVRASTLGLLKAMNVESLDDSLTSLDWSIGAVTHSIEHLTNELSGGVEEGVSNAIRELLDTVAGLKVKGASTQQIKNVTKNTAANKTAQKQQKVVSRGIPSDKHIAVPSVNKLIAKTPANPILEKVKTSKTSTKLHDKPLGKNKRVSKEQGTVLAQNPAAKKQAPIKLPAVNQLNVQSTVEGDLASILDLAPQLLKAADLKGPAKALKTAMPALKQLDLQGIASGDLSSVLDAGPDLLKAANLKGPAKALKTAMPALKQLDLQGIAARDLSSVLDAGPDLLKAANLKGPAKALKTAMPALRQLDLQGIASGDLSSVLDAGPDLLKAANLKGPAKALKTAMPALKQLDLQGIVSGDLSSVLDAGPDLLKAANLKGPAKALKTAMPALKQLDLQGIASGDMSSLLDVGPDLLKVANFQGPADALKKSLPALKQLDMKGIMGGDLQSLVKAGPDLLNSFGLNDAASAFEKHSSAIGKLDFKGILNGDLSSIGDAATDFFENLGTEDAPEEQKDKPSKRNKKRNRRRNKAKRKGAKSRQFQPRSNTQPWVKDTQDDTDKSSSNKHKGKLAQSPKPALKVLDGGRKDNSKQAATPNKSQSANQAKLGKGVAANDPIFGGNKQAKPKVGGFVKRLMKNPLAKTLGRFTGPLRTIMSAADIGGTLADDSLSKREKSKQIGSAAGGAGGALAGAAAGAAIGSIIPGVGTLIGGAIGGAIGSFGGESLGGFLGDWFGSSLEDSDVKETAAEQSLNIANVDASLGGAANDPRFELGGSHKELAGDSSRNAKAGQAHVNRKSALAQQLTDQQNDVLIANPNELNALGQKTTSDKSPAQHVNSSVTVNANITVNATPDMSALEIAEQIKLVLEEKQQQAQRDIRLRYIDEVA
ncbi:hypothetical protein [Pseudoalteromonas byunsanensis]|uniref:Phage tail tape measure protein n=1 Tax=Pseudoalteromonas byunsanensis TaxID=327939 RepID=A0A1S1NBP4_9GAMM|nr:hypothetical protein [Pseudoalteromonas byunsanensis]OHU96806.1 hypothetical protein BIW53_05645 [Pseudoalteromonas byunsanensis]